jgi:hypothetical protein
MKRLYQLMDKIRQIQIESTVSSIQNNHSTLINNNNRENSQDSNTIPGAKSSS